MKFNVPQQISNFVSSQFPAFYNEQGPDFMLFLEAYYEWMEQTGQPIGEARSLFNNRDIDNTLESFLVHFQEKYLYGIPFNVIINKRFLLKHILDVYRSKGSIQGYRLLFKLIYNQDVEIYLPSIDILKPSDGTWVSPKYLEVTGTNLGALVGGQIVGRTNGTVATVEDHIQEAIHNNIVHTLYLSNIVPPDGDFVVGETVVSLNEDGTFGNNFAQITGSMAGMTIINGQFNYSIGDYLTIPHYDPSNTATVVANGVDGVVKVTNTSTEFGSVNIFISNPGTGVSANATKFVYLGAANATGNGAAFSIGSISSISYLNYNTDLICNYANVTLNAATFGFVGNTGANATNANLNQIFTYANNIFGSLQSIQVTNIGVDYTVNPVAKVQSTQISTILPGTISYNTTSNTVTGVGTAFDQIFSGSNTSVCSIIALVANGAHANTYELHPVLSVTNATSLILADTPRSNSTANSVFLACPSVFPSALLPSDPLMHTTDGTIGGINAQLGTSVDYGAGIITEVQIVDSGRNYYEGETISLYRFNSANKPQIILGGRNYSNGETLIFVGGGTNKMANGYVTTNGNGTIVNTTMTSYGSGYVTLPSVAVQTANGSGAVLTTSLTSVNTALRVQGVVHKGGIGVKRGYWSTTRGFLNSNKYIQDSYFYQAFSYQIRVATTLEEYKDILYNTFHPAGSEMFGRYTLNDLCSAPMTIGAEVGAAGANAITFSPDFVTGGTGASNTLILLT